MPLYALQPSSQTSDSQAQVIGRPTRHPSAFVAPSADVIGMVRLGARSSVWFGAVLRGDTEVIVVGEGSNIQDGAVLHADPGFPCTLGAGVTVGHRAVVHGATCGAGSLVGMGAIMLNGSRLGEGAVLGAWALLPEGREVPAGMLAVGIPARVVGPAQVGTTAEHYVQNAARFRQSVREVSADECTDLHPTDPQPEAVLSGRRA